MFSLKKERNSNKSYNMMKLEDIMLTEIKGQILCDPTYMRHLVRVKEMAPHSSTLVWKIPWMEEPGRLQSMGSLRVGHD